MYKRIDIGEATVEGYSYHNKDGNEEYVKVNSACFGDSTIIDIKNSCGDVICIYTDDIPKLIKALEAAYNHKE